MIKYIYIIQKIIYFLLLIYLINLSIINLSYGDWGLGIGPNPQSPQTKVIYFFNLLS